MHENILLISENDTDYRLLKKVLKSHRISVTQSPFDKNIDKKILSNGFPLILADYDLIRDKADLFFEIQKGKSKACLIFYGDRMEAEEVNQILQKGVYTVIPRPFLAERIHDAIIGGLENRKAFIEILNMMDELKVVNLSLERETTTLKKRNQELSFLNLLSSEISYDLNWDRILSRMIDAGLEKALDYSLFGLLYSMGAEWYLSLHTVPDAATAEVEALKSEILSRLLPQHKEKISMNDIHFRMIPLKNGEKESAGLLEGFEIFPLSLAGKRMGSVFYTPRLVDRAKGDGGRLINTLASILSLSLKNAQEYHKLREAAVTDSLTGIYNRNGLFEFLKREFHRARRYKKSLSFVMIDMDDFKSINDSMGHQAGDYILRELAGILKNSIRKPDIVARYGGDEFAILLPEATNSKAKLIMRRISLNTGKHTFEWGSGRIKTSMSYGISNIHELQEGDTEENLVELADSRLYDSKNS